MQTVTPPPCSKCQGTMIEKTSKKNNSIYFACPNWKPNNMGCEGEMWFPPRNVSTGRNGVPRMQSTPEGLKTPQNEPQSTTNGKQIVAVEMVTLLQSINTHLEDIKRLLDKNPAEEVDLEDVPL